MFPLVGLSPCFTSKRDQAPQEKRFSQNDNQKQANQAEVIDHSRYDTRMHNPPFPFPMTTLCLASPI